MRIGFDVSQTGRMKAGCGYFADSLIQALAEVDHENEYILYPTFGDGVWDAEWPRSTRQIPSHPRFRRGPGHRTREALEAFWRTPPGDLETRLGSPDIVHANNFHCPSGLKKARLVYTLYDLGFMAHPEWTTEENRLTCFNGVFAASLHADHIIAISEYTRRHFLETFPHYPADRVTVVYPASRFAGPAGGPRPERLSRLAPGEFWLSVGTLEPRKNYGGLLEAYARLKAQIGHVFPLVLAGRGGWLIDNFAGTVEALGLGQDVLPLGYVEDASLQWLYENCFAFCYLSLFEGFGLPVVEAMSCGAAVVSSSVTSLPEIVGSAGLLVDPTGRDEIVEAMRDLQAGVVDGATLRSASRERAKRFAWVTTAGQVREVYRSVMFGVTPTPVSDGDWLLS